jgi:hypothetical protein
MKKRQPRNGSIYSRGNVYWVKYYRNGRPFRESAHSARYQDAERLLKRRQGEIVTGRFGGLEPERVRMKDLFDAVLADYRDNDRQSLAHVERRLRLHLLPAFADVRAAEFGTFQVKKYVSDRRREEASNATVNRELSIVKRALHLAAKADPPQVWRVPHIPMLEENNVRKGFLEHDAYRRLRDALPEEVRLLFGCGLPRRLPQGRAAANRVAPGGPASQANSPRTRHDKEQGGPDVAHLRRDAGMARARKGRA